jgi:hypothetical protein
LILNAAAWVAFWVWASGRVTRSWVKVRYKAPAPAAAPSSPPPPDGSCGPHVVEVRGRECGRYSGSVGSLP